MRQTDVPGVNDTATRRKLLALVGAGAAVPLAGCGGSSGGDDSDPGTQEDDQENGTEDPPGNSTAPDDEEGGDDNSGTDDGSCPELPLSYTTLETPGFDPGLQFDVPDNWTDDVRMPSSLTRYESTLVISYPPVMDSESWGIQFTFQMHDPSTEGFDNPQQVGVDGVAANFLDIDVDDQFIETTSEYDRDIYTRIVRDTNAETLSEFIIFPYGDKVIEANGAAVWPEETNCPEAAEAVYRRVVNTLEPAE